MAEANPEDAEKQQGLGKYLDIGAASSVFVEGGDSVVQTETANVESETSEVHAGNAIISAENIGAANIGSAIIQAQSVNIYNYPSTASYKDEAHKQDEVHKQDEAHKQDEVHKQDEGPCDTPVPDKMMSLSSEICDFLHDIHVTDISLINPPMDHDTMFALVEILKQSPKLSDLVMNNCGMDHELLDRFFRMLSCVNSKVERLQLNGNKQMGGGFERLGSIIKHLHVKHLELKLCSLSHEDLNDLHKGLDTFKLRTLNLTDTVKFVQSVLIQALTKLCSKVTEELVLVDWKFTSLQVKQLKNNQSIFDLKITTRAFELPICEKDIDAKGGELEINDFKVIFPPAAVDHEITASISPEADFSSFPEEYLAISPILHCKASGIEKFLKPVKFEIPSWVVPEQGLVVSIMHRRNDREQWQIIEDLCFEYGEKIVFYRKDFCSIGAAQNISQKTNTVIKVASSLYCNDYFIACFFPNDKTAIQQFESQFNLKPIETIDIFEASNNEKITVCLECYDPKNAMCFHESAQTFQAARLKNGKVSKNFNPKNACPAQKTIVFRYRVSKEPNSEIDSKLFTITWPLKIERIYKNHINVGGVKANNVVVGSENIHFKQGSTLDDIPSTSQSTRKLRKRRKKS